MAVGRRWHDNGIVAPHYDRDFRHYRRGGWWHGSSRSGRLRRDPTDRMVGGVAAGVSAWTGLDVTIVRLGFVLASLVGGFGAAAYVLAWLTLPTADEATSIAS